MFFIYHVPEKRTDPFYHTPIWRYNENMQLWWYVTVTIQLLCLVSGFWYDPMRTLDIGNEQNIFARESQKLQLKRRGIKFIDVTDHTTLPWLKDKSSQIAVPRYAYPDQITKQETFEYMVSKIEEKEMYNNLAKFTSFFTRYYKSHHGFKSATWLSSKINDTVSGLPQDFVSVEHHYHPDWKQFSITVSVKGSIDTDHILIVGSHQDTMNLLFPSWIASPGADDNGSGTITVLESLRIYVQLLQGGYQPKNSVQFHFYSAEEGGLLGSFDILSKYRQADKKVVAMLQQDMTGYVQDPKDEHVGLITDYTSPELNNFLKLIITSYLSIPFKESTCGYACSDHGSATKNGYPASFVLESVHAKSNKYIHTTMDTLDRLSFSHMKEHVKLVLGYILELDNWTFLEKVE